MVTFYFFKIDEKREENHVIKLIYPQQMSDILFYQYLDLLDLLDLLDFSYITVNPIPAILSLGF